MVENENIQIRMLPFGTNRRASWENDILMNHEVYTHMIHKKAVLDYDLVLNSVQMDVAFGDLDYAICMRFHSHVYAVRHSIPFISMHDHPKVQFLLKDVSIESVALKNYDFEEFCIKWQYLKHHEAQVKIALRRYAESAYEKKCEIENVIIDTVSKCDTHNVRKYVKRKCNIL